jgi:FAD/FMN-containing dehydrogenase
MTIDNPALDALRGAVGAAVLAPGDDGFEAACGGFELAIRHRPAVVVLPESADGVVQAVRFARANDMSVAVQATGHGQLWAAEGGMLINTSRFRKVSIDAERAIARVEGGARWRDVLPAAYADGLAALCGTSPDVGVVGYTLGGGTGWLSRRYGYASDSVVAAEIVTGEGRLLRLTEHENADLFWAVRGAGGSFGVVTALEFRLYPVPEVYAGTLFFPIERAREIFAAYTRWTETVPADLTSTICVMHLPPLPFVPEPLRGKSVVAVQLCYAGDTAEGAEIVSALRELRPMFDFVSTMPYTRIGTVANEPEDPGHSLIGTESLAAMPDDLIDRVLEAVGDRTRTGLAIIAFRHLEGAYRHAPEDASAVSRPDLKYLMVSVGPVFHPSMEARVGHDTRALVDLLRPYSAGAPVRNFLAANSAARAEAFELFSDTKYRRLARMKDRHDPDNLFRFGVPFRPAGRAGTLRPNLPAVPITPAETLTPAPLQ